MAEPVRGTLIEELKRDELHVDDIRRCLEFLDETFGREQIPFAVIGAIAMQHHGYVRFTEDVDIVTTGDGLDRIHEAVVGLGLLPRAPGLRKRLRQTQFKVNVDVVTEGEHAGSDQSPVVFPHPHSSAFVERGGIFVATLATLITLKIASGVWGNRDQDFADVQKLIRGNGLEEAFAGELPAPLRERYRELLERSRMERDIE